MTKRVNEMLEEANNMKNIVALRSTIGVTNMQIKRQLVKVSKFVKLDKSHMKPS